MSRPDFSLIWGADNAPFTPIEASDYAAGWVFRTGAPPRRVNFDYFQNLADERAIWLDQNKANLDSPIFTGTPTAPNPSTGLRSQALATMQKFADEFGSSLADSGWQKLPSGLIEQWGGATFTGTSLVVTLPIAFTVGMFSCSAIDAESDPAAIKKIAVITSSTTSITFACDVNAGTFLWRAIGK